MSYVHSEPGEMGSQPISNLEQTTYTSIWAKAHCYYEHQGND